MKKFLIFVLFVFSIDNVMAVPTLYETQDYTANWNINSARNLNGTERVIGSIDSYYGGNPADLFSFKWGGGHFIADTRFDSRYLYSEEYFNSDTRLTLFDKLGNTIISNDNWFAGVKYARIDLELSEGLYFIGVSSGDHVTISGDSNIYPISNINDYLTINTSNLSYMLNLSTTPWWFAGDAYKLTYGDISYRSIVNDEIPTTIPEPGILFLMITGFIILLFARKIK